MTRAPIAVMTFRGIREAIHDIRAAALVIALLAAGCVNGDVHLYEVRARGRATVAAGQAGKLRLELHVARFKGPGALAHPLGVFAERTPASLDPIDETVLYPSDTGEGLVIYGWLDRDGDGILCAPGVRDEPAGIVEVKTFPAHEVDFTLPLDRDCAGPEALYP